MGTSLWRRYEPGKESEGGGGGQNEAFKFVYDTFSYSNFRPCIKGPTLQLGNPLDPLRHYSLFLACLYLFLAKY